MNWGYKILMVYIIFIMGILFLVFKSSTQNQDLVTSDYYEQELKYQQRIDETMRANALSTEVKYEIEGQVINILLPEEMKGKEIKAHVSLYCPADKSKDLEHDFTTGNAQLNMSIPAINKGMYELKINWMWNKTGYYYQHKIIIK